LSGDVWAVADAGATVSVEQEVEVELTGSAWEAVDAGADLRFRPVLDGSAGAVTDAGSVQLFRPIMNGSASETVDAGAGLQFKPVLEGSVTEVVDVASAIASTTSASYAPSTDVWEEVGVGANLQFKPVVTGSITETFDSGAVYAGASYPDAGVAEVFDAGATLWFAPVLTGDANTWFTVAADIATTTSQAYTVVADTAVTVDAGSDVSASITPVGNVEVGTAVWSVYGGVSTLYATVQQDAGVPIGSFAVGDSTYAYVSATKTDYVYAGAVEEVFTVGTTVGTDVIILPVVDGVGIAEFSYSSDLSIYSTPQFLAPLIDGSVCFVVAEPVTEYWVDIAGDRAFPLHDWAAVADYSTSSEQHWVYADGAVESFDAGSTLYRGFIPVPSVYEVLSAGADVLAYTSQAIVYAGTAVEIVGTASEHPIAAHVADVGATAVISASIIEIGPYPSRAIYEEGSASANLWAGTLYSVSQPTNYAAVGDVVFNAESLSEKAVCNLHDALAEYAASSGGAGVYDPWGYSDNYEQEPVPGWVHGDEPKPSQTNTEEPLPTRPAGQDGVYVVDSQDGPVTEPPRDGAYVDVGYYKEFKPWYQPNTKEALPTSTRRTEDKPT